MNKEIPLEDFIEKVDNLIIQIDAYYSDRLYLELFSKIASSLDCLEEPYVKERFSLRMTKGKIGDKYGVKFLEAHFLNCLGFYVLNNVSRIKNPILISRFKFFDYDFYDIQDGKNNKNSLFRLKEVK